MEPNQSGHRLYYVRLLAQAAVARGDEVVLALSEAASATDESGLHLSGIAESVTIVSARDFGVDAVAELSRRYDAAITVVPDGDRFAMRLARTRGGWSGQGALSVLIMREVAQPGRLSMVVAAKSRIRTALFHRASRLPRVRLSVLKSATWTGDSMFACAPDPVSLACGDDDISELRAAWNLEDDRYWFGVLGAIFDRKNVPLVARALRAAEAQNSGLLIAGRCDPEAARAMAGPLAELTAAGAKVVVVDRLLSELELDAAVTAVDCVVLAHSNEGPSGLFGKAAAAGTRVVAAGALSLREDARHVPSLASWVPLDETALMGAMRRAQALHRPTAVFAPENARFAEALL
ncbi:hypothetical protein [Streptomyces sp. L7]|uniref:hypothetical protein n=1 Tax=Streptomyces sp. L7 TaxID=3423954 RepID=UPI003D96FFAA